jgi:hypothetical protein
MDNRMEFYKFSDGLFSGTYAELSNLIMNNVEITKYDTDDIQGLE